MKMPLKVLIENSSWAAAVQEEYRLENGKLVKAACGVIIVKAPFNIFHSREDIVGGDESLMEFLEGDPMFFEMDFPVAEKYMLEITPKYVAHIGGERRVVYNKVSGRIEV